MGTRSRNKQKKGLHYAQKKEEIQGVERGFQAGSMGEGNRKKYQNGWDFGEGSTLKGFRKSGCIACYNIVLLASSFKRLKSHIILQAFGYTFVILGPILGRNKCISHLTFIIIL